MGLAGGGELRVHGPRRARASVLLVGGGTRASRPGRWSASMTWLAPRVARAIAGDVRVAQLRYRDSSWNRLQLGIADVREAIARERGELGAGGRVVLVGLSMGGATCLANAGQTGVAGLVAMAPWFPSQLPLDPLVGKRLFVVHGQLDNALPLVSGTSRAASRETVERARALGADAEWRDLPLGLHGLAVQWRERTCRLPRAGAYARLLAREAACIAEGGITA